MTYPCTMYNWPSWKQDPGPASPGFVPSVSECLGDQQLGPVALDTSYLLVSQCGDQFDPVFYPSFALLQSLKHQVCVGTPMVCGV